MQTSKKEKKLFGASHKKKSFTLTSLGLALAACGGKGAVSNFGGTHNFSGGPDNSLEPHSLQKGALQPTTSTLWGRTLEVYGVKLVVGGAVGRQAEVRDDWAYFKY